MRQWHMNEVCSFSNVCVFMSAHQFIFASMLFRFFSFETILFLCLSHFLSSSFPIVIASIKLHCECTVFWYGDTHILITNGVKWKQCAVAKLIEHTHSHTYVQWNGVGWISTTYFFFHFSLLMIVIVIVVVQISICKSIRTKNFN